MGEAAVIHKQVARNLRFIERDLLVEHVDGEMDVPVPVFVKERMTARNSLIAKGLIRPDRPHRATKTIITEDGRQVLAVALAEYAEALLRAGYTGFSSPLIRHPREIPLQPIADDRKLADVD